MLKKIGSFLFSTRLTAVLFLVFAAAMAAGTFLDASSQSPPTPYTRELIYNAWWFEAIMGIFIINFVGNIFRYGLHKRKMWASLMLHLALILVIVGAFVTRYIDRKSTRLNSSHVRISYAVFCLKKKKKKLSLVSTQYNKMAQHTGWDLRVSITRRIHSAGGFVETGTTLDTRLVSSIRLATISAR